MSLQIYTISVWAALAAAAAPLPKLRAAVIVPGFLNDANDYAPLARALTKRGLPTAVVPMPLWHWIPTIGGRSVRPVLERIDHAVRHVSAMGESAASSTTDMLTVPAVEYSLDDIWQDFRGTPGGVFEVGGSSTPDEFPVVQPRGRFPAPSAAPSGSVAVIGCSAGGYMARIYLSSRAYGGKVYGGSELVHSLVTLGTPHLAGQGVPFENVRWINREPLPEGLRALAVGATGTPSSEALAGAYAFCDPTGNGGEGLEGDGVTTSESATALCGAETRLLDGVTHYPWTSAPLHDLLVPELAHAYREGKPWYGSEEILDEWLPWLLAPWSDGDDDA